MYGKLRRPNWGSGSSPGAPFGSAFSLLIVLPKIWEAQVWGSSEQRMRERNENESSSNEEVNEVNAWTRWGTENNIKLGT